MVIKVLNLDKLLKKFDSIGNIDVMPIISKGTRLVQRSAKQKAPVDKGVLRNSIKTKLYPKQNSGIVYTTTEYAPYQEFGTRKMKAQPFMQPAFDENQSQIKKDLKDHIKGHLRNPRSSSKVESKTQRVEQVEPEKALGVAKKNDHTFFNTARRVGVNNKLGHSGSLEGSGIKQIRNLKHKNYKK